ncbi:MAG: monofunctional biosynthetic peptidoglycan transglycosylase [Bdellovibrio bacteriovorus]
MSASESPGIDEASAIPAGQAIGAADEPGFQPGVARWRALRQGLLLSWRFLVGALIALALGSVATVGVLRWVDPPASAFMLRHARVAAELGRPPPHYHHRWVPWEEIPVSVRLAAIAAEDQRFPLHHGFDPVEIRKAWSHYRTGGTLRGASTITQQTAKNLFLWPERSWLRKGLEAWFTAWIELLWPKERILEVYLNIVQFSPSTYGVGAASERYFGRPVSSLSLEEASLLAGVLPAPGAYRLDRPSPRLRRRADWIADQTRRLGGSRYLERL